jgi:hypothetical protein
VATFNLAVPSVFTIVPDIPLTLILSLGWH